MHHKHIFEALDRTLQDIVGNDMPFGGISIVCAGDFRQTLPITRHANRSQTVNSCLKRSLLWPLFRTFALVDNIRVRRAMSAVEDPLHKARLLEFSQWLLNVGEGVSNRSATDQWTSVDSFCCTRDSFEPADIRHMLAHVYGNFQHALRPTASVTDCSAWLVDRCVLAPHHSTVAQINCVATDMLPGAAWSCIGASRAEENYPIPSGYLDTLCPSSVPPSVLTLKPHMPVIVLRNLDPKRGVCNGTRILILKVHDYAVIEAVVMSGCSSFVGTVVHIPRIKLFADDGMPFKWSRVQFPVRPAFALTVAPLFKPTCQCASRLHLTPLFGPHADK